MASEQPHPAAELGVLVLGDPSVTREPSQPRPAFGMAVSAYAGELRVEVRGDLDLATAPRLATCLSDLRPHAAALCLDLTGVGFIDLGGLRVLLEAQSETQARGGEWRVVSGAAAQRLFELTHTTHLLGPN